MSSVEAGGAAKQALDSIETLRWNYRVILVVAPSQSASRAIENLTMLDDRVRDRDIAWFVLSSDMQMATNYPGQIAPGLDAWIREHYFTPQPKETAVLLIGKDGGVKSRGVDLDLDSTFELIDSMPMRQAEMRQARDQ